MKAQKVESPVAGERGAEGMMPSASLPRAISGLRVSGISKGFPGVKALDRVGFDVHPGEVHALVGENGAGKSTLLKILSGLYQADEGSLEIDGRRIEIVDPEMAGIAGIAVIHQELNLIPWLNVAQNIYLGRETEIGRGILSRRKLYEMARQHLAALDVDIDPRSPVVHLGVAEQQMVEIARALSQDATYVLMDEPTASLSEREAAVLFEKIEGLRARNVGIVYISHRLDEVKRLADRVTVLRDGKVVAHSPMTSTTIDEIITHMVGRPMEGHFPARDPSPGEVVLSVAPPDHNHRSRRLDVRAGEIIGIGGLVGAGRTDWAWRLIGALPSIGETVTLNGWHTTIRSPAEARALGLGMAPESRKEHGLILDRPVTDNLSLTVLDRLKNRWGLIDRERQTRLCQDYVDRLRIKTPNLGTQVRTLSGGNQQKIVLAKWLARNCDVIVMDEPTRGIDVGAKFEMYALINELSKTGKAIIMISSELPELMAMSDRIYVMHDGDLVAEFGSAAFNAETIMHYASGLFESVDQ